MRFSIVVAVSLVAAVVATPIRADQADPRLRGLFDQLHATTDGAEAAKVTDRIWSIWVSSDDPMANELMAAGVAYLSMGRHAEALARFDVPPRGGPVPAPGTGPRRSARRCSAIRRRPATRRPAW